MFSKEFLFYYLILLFNLSQQIYIFKVYCLKFCSYLKEAHVCYVIQQKEFRQ